MKIRKQIGKVTVKLEMPLYEGDAVEGMSYPFDWEYVEPGSEDGRMGVCRRVCNVIEAPKREIFEKPVEVEVREGL